MASSIYGTVEATILANGASMTGQLFGVDENLFFVSGGNKLVGMGVAQPIICAHCNTPVADVVGASLLISVRHHGEQHKTLIPIEDILSAAKNPTVL